jgi:hypothetical protein
MKVNVMLLAMRGLFRIFASAYLYGGELHRGDETLFLPIRIRLVGTEDRQLSGWFVQ